MTKCQHCGQDITDGVQLPSLSHLSGRNAWLNRCAPTDSGQEYGYVAHPAGTDCPSYCLGTSE